MTEQPHIASERLLLSPLQIEDAKSLFDYRSRPDIYRFQSWMPKKLEDAKNFISTFSGSSSPKRDHWFQFGIYLKESNQLIGDCGFCLQKDNTAEIGYTISPEFQKMGYGFESVHALIDYLSKHFAIRRILARTDTRNSASIALLQKLGFAQEGLYPKSVNIRGEWQDDLVFYRTFKDKF